MFNKLKKFLQDVFVCNDNKSSCCNNNKTEIIVRCHRCDSKLKDLICDDCKDTRKHLYEVFDKSFL